MNTLFFFFNDTATTEIYTLSLHDALPILYLIFIFSLILVGIITKLFSIKLFSGINYRTSKWSIMIFADRFNNPQGMICNRCIDRKSTRLNSSHANISYAVFCLKKKYRTPT